jgi:hypothetical protein
MKTVVETLEAAIALIRTPDRWCTYSLARDIAGHDVPPKSPLAVRWCAVGALKQVADVPWVAGWAEYELLKTTDGTLVSYVNDFRGHAAVILVFNETIARLRKESP